MPTTATLALSGSNLTLEQIEHVALEGVAIGLEAGAQQRIEAARKLVEETAESDLRTYGLNTGVGQFVEQDVPEGHMAEVQHRLLRSHSCGVGDPYEPAVVRAALLLRVNTFALGYSGVRVELAERLCEMLNRGIVPHVPARGSVGASGDLSPLAHLALPLIGEGSAWVMQPGDSYADVELLAGAEALAQVQLEPLTLASKEGLSLINGTQFMLAMGALYARRARRLMQICDLGCALSVEALRGSRESFVRQIHELRPFPGQLASAANLYDAMDGSSILESHRYCDRVQDAYALRCAPQVHGASRDALAHAERTFEIETAAVTDNPLVFVDEQLMRSNGNFHGQPLAMALDFLAMGLAELANISERRIERLVNPRLSGLPAFLVREGGLNSGFMIAQYTAASLVSENKVLSHPASVDSIPTSASQEDHVSMGNHAGLKLRQVLENAEHVLAIELLCAAQAVDFLHPRQPGRIARALYDTLREHVDHLGEDRVLSGDIAQVAQLIRSGELLHRVQESTGWQCR